MFFDKVCTIQKYTLAKANWEQYKTWSDVYTWIVCDYFEWRNKLTTTDFSKIDSNWTYTVLIEKDKTLVEEGYKIIVTDELWNSWTYEVENVFYYKSISWLTDNIELTCKRLYD